MTKVRKLSLLALGATAALSLAGQSAFALGTYDWNGATSNDWTNNANWYPKAPATGGTLAAPVVSGNFDLGTSTTAETYALTYDPANNAGITDPTYEIGGIFIGQHTAAELDVLSGSLTFEDQQYNSSVAWDGSAGAINVNGGTLTFLSPTGGAGLAFGHSGTDTANGVGTVSVTNGTLNVDGGLYFNYDYNHSTLTVGQGGLVTVNNSDQATPTAGTTTLGFGSRIVLTGNGIFEQTGSSTINFNSHNGSYAAVAFQAGGNGMLSLFDGGSSGLSAIESQLSTAITGGYIDSISGSTLTPLTSLSQLAFAQSGNQAQITLAPTAPTPEPASLGLLAIAGAGMLLLHRRKRMA